MTIHDAADRDAFLLRPADALTEDLTETLEVVLGQSKVVQHVREKFTCRECEKISQAPAPLLVLPRGFAGPSLLAIFRRRGVG
jgi:transposase